MLFNLQALVYKCNSQIIASVPCHKRTPIENVQLSVVIDSTDFTAVSRKFGFTEISECLN